MDPIAMFDGEQSTMAHTMVAMTVAQASDDAMASMDSMRRMGAIDPQCHPKFHPTFDPTLVDIPENTIHLNIDQH